MLFMGNECFNWITNILLQSVRKGIYISAKIRNDNITQKDVNDIINNYEEFMEEYVNELDKDDVGGELVDPGDALE